MNTTPTNVSSTSQRLPISDNYKLVAFGIQLVILAFGAVFNLLLMNAIIKDPLKTFKSPSSSFIFNIAFVDVLVCILWIIKISFRHTTPGCKETRKSLFRVWIASIAISPLLYLGLSIERFCSVAYPLWHRVHVTTRVCRYWLCAIWFVHIVFETLLSYFVQEVVSYKNIIILLLFVGISFLLTQAFYLATYFSLKKQRERIFKRQNISEAALGTIKIRLQRERQFLHTLAIVCFILNLTLLPTLTFMIVYVIYPKFSTLQRGQPRIIFHHLLLIFLSFNFAINPIFYGWRLPKYRKTFKLMYCKFL